MVDPGTKFQRPRWLRGGLRILRLVALTYVALTVFLYFYQRRLLYFPSPESPPLPTAPGFAGIEDVRLQTTDGIDLEAWHWPGSRPLTLVVFHGNGGHRGHRSEWLRTLHELGWGIFIIDYRGYGGSQGSPTESGLYQDAEAAHAWLTAQGDQGLVYVGESLGGGMAIELARRHPPRAIILQSTFTSAVAVGKAGYPFLPVSLLMKDRYANIEKIGELECPILVIHGTDDTLVPVEFGRELHAAIRSPKEWYEVRRAGHNDVPWVGGAEYLQRVNAFLERYSATK